MDEQRFAVDVANKFRQIFHDEFCHSCCASNRDGTLRNDFISPENLIRSLSSEHATLITLDFLGVRQNRFDAEQAIVFLYLYKQILHRGERKRRQCSNRAELTEAMSFHENDLKILRKTIDQWKAEKGLIPGTNDLGWVSSVALFFQGNDRLNCKKALHGKLPDLQ